MPLSGVNATDGDDAGLAYLAHVSDSKRRVRYWANRIGSSCSPDNGFYPSVYALRILAEAERSTSRIAVVKSEVDSWEKCFLQWFERTQKKFPKKVAPDEYKARVLEELGRLRKLSVNLPRSNWEKDAERDLNAFGEFGKLKLRYD